MTNILIGLQNERCLIHKDDIIFFTPSVYYHISRLNDVYKILRNACLKIQLDKCELLKTEVGHLGHILTLEGVKSNTSKIDCIKNFPEPRNTKDIKSFLGLSVYYRRFSSDFAKLSKPLEKLLQKDIRFCFTDKCKKLFQILKETLISLPILINPHFQESVVLKTDASAIAIGSVISQVSIDKDPTINVQ